MLLTAGLQHLKPPLEVMYSPLQFGALDFLGVRLRVIPMLEDWVVAFKARYARLYECRHCPCTLSWGEAKKQQAADGTEMR